MSAPRFYLLGFGALMAFDTLTQVSLKFVALHTGEFNLALGWFAGATSTGWIVGAIAGYLGAFGTWMTLLKHAPIGPAFAAAHLEVVPVLAISATVFGEKLNAAQLAGAACILLGVICLGVGKSRSPGA